MKKAEILSQKETILKTGVSQVKDYRKTHYCVAYNNSPDNPSSKPEIKEIAEDWRVDWYDKERNGIADVMEQGHLGVPTSLFVYTGKNKLIDVEKTLAKAEKEGHIIIINNPNKQDEKVQTPKNK